MTSTIKVNNIQNQCGANIINESSNTITIGASGDTVTLASGASQSGFGRTGTVDWQTGSIKTSNFTAANGEGYFCNTSGGAFTATLPASPSAGDIVSFVDYTNSFQTNNLTIGRNSEPIGGIAADAILSTEGQSVTFVYVDGTEGWKNIQDSTSNATGNPFIVATGGTITTSGNCKIHTFTGPGTFCVSQVHPCAANNEVSYLVVAGGGGGGAYFSGGGGGAGGFREDKSPVTPYTASPLDGAGPITVTATSFPITVGGGGPGGPSGAYPSQGSSGSNSVFSTKTSAGGGGGGGLTAPGPPGTNDGLNGGSGGGGGGYCSSNAGPGGTGNTPPVSPAQGKDGGSSSTSGPDYGAGGGGGATTAGTNGQATGSGSGNGGNGATTCISASPTTYAGGGGGAATPSGPVGAGGSGGGGSGSPTYPGGGVAGTDNTGGGGGGSASATGANGGSGIVIIRYKFK